MLMLRRDGQSYSRQTMAPTLLHCYRDYLSTGEAKTGEQALGILKSKQLPTNDAVKATDILLNVPHAPDLLDSLLATLLARNFEARKVVAARFSAKATEVFDLLFDRGEQSFKNLVTIPLENGLWKSKDSQATAQRDLFQLSIATLIAAGVEHLERVMQPVARLLSAVPDTIAGIIDEDVTDAIRDRLRTYVSMRLFVAKRCWQLRSCWKRRRREVNSCLPISSNLGHRDRPMTT